MALRIGIDRSLTLVTPRDGHSLSADEFKDAIDGGPLEWVRLTPELPDGRVLYLVIDEQGRLYDPPLPLNLIATLLYRGSRKQGTGIDMIILGPALLTTCRPETDTTDETWT